MTVRIALLAVRTGGRAGLMTRSIGRVTQMLYRFSALVCLQVTEHVCRKSCQNERRTIACSSTKKLSCVSHRPVLYSCFMGCLASVSPAKDQCSPADKLWFAFIARCAPCSPCIFFAHTFAGQLRSMPLSHFEGILRVAKQNFKCLAISLQRCSSVLSKGFRNFKRKERIRASWAMWSLVNLKLGCCDNLNYIIL